MRTGWDLDGVIDRRSHKFLPPSLKEIREAKIILANLISQGNQIIIVTARPNWMWLITVVWLWLFRVPHHSLVITESWQSKLAILINLDVDVYFDDIPEFVEWFCQNGINAKHFNGWHNVKETIAL